MRGKAFTDDEWMGLIIRTLGYEPTHYGEAGEDVVAVPADPDRT